MLLRAREQEVFVLVTSKRLDHLVKGSASPVDFEDLFSLEALVKATIW